MPTQLTLTSLDVVVCTATLLGSLIAGLWLGIRKTSRQSSDGFFLAGRQLTWPVVGASLFATNIGAEHLVGLSGDSYRYGLKAGTVELGTAICLGIACWVLFPTYIKNKVFTIPEFLERRYDVRARLFFSGLMLLICVMTKMAFTLFAGALVVHSLLGWEVMSVYTDIASGSGGYNTGWFRSRCLYGHDPDCDHDPGLPANAVPGAGQGWRLG